MGSDPKVKEQGPKFTIKYFPIDQTNNFSQLQATMTEAEYTELSTGKKNQELDLNPGKGKMLAILMDRSGSMSA